MFDVYGAAGVTGITYPTTILADWEGIRVLRGRDSIWIMVDQGFEPQCFDEAIRLLGLRDRDDYEIIYDPKSGRETYIFDGRINQEPVRTVRDRDDSGVLHGLPLG